MPNGARIPVRLSKEFWTVKYRAKGFGQQDVVAPGLFFWCSLRECDHLTAIWLKADATHGYRLLILFCQPFSWCPHLCPSNIAENLHWYWLDSWSSLGSLIFTISSCRWLIALQARQPGLECLSAMAVPVNVSSKGRTTDWSGYLHEFVVYINV